MERHNYKWVDEGTDKRVEAHKGKQIQIPLAYSKISLQKSL